MIRHLLVSLILILTLSSWSFSQTAPKRELTPLFKSGNVGYLADIANASVNNSEIVFVLLVVEFIPGIKPGDVKADENNYAIMLVRADCDTKKFAVIAQKGKSNGTPFQGETKDQTMKSASPESDDEDVITTVCHEKLGLKA
jgi:hypothetical protein